MIRVAETDEEILGCFDVRAELRTRFSIGA